MKQKNFLKIAMLFGFALISNLSFGQILSEAFDNDSNFAKSETFANDGISDYFGILDPTGATNDFDNNTTDATPNGVPGYTGNVGNYLVGEDLDGELSSATQTLIWANLNITGYTDLNLSVKLAAGSGFDEGDGITLAANIDDNGYTNISSFTVASGFNQFPTDGTTTLSTTMQTITASIAETGSSMDLKLTLKAGAGNEEFAVDDIVIDGTAGSSPTIGFDAATSSQTETDATFNVSIPITVSNYGTDQIDISVAASGAAEVADYTLNTASLSFTADGSKNISLDINPDSDDFDDEEIILTITETSSVTGLIISQATHTITVTEDETAPSIGFDSATSSETETDITFTSANIPITVSNYSDTQIDINISVTGGTAEVGDYTFTSPTTLSFTEDSSKNITLEINDDADTDGETVILTITENSSVTGLTISQSSHTLTIADDEIPSIPTSGTIFITEVLDSDNGFNNDYLELFNNSNEEVSLYTSKLLRFSSAGVYEYSFDFGTDEATASIDLIIPAYGFLIIARSNTRADFNTANSITLDAGVNYNGGNSELFFGTGRRWKLKTGGTLDTNDGDLIDDTLEGKGTTKDYRNIFTNTFITGTSSEGTPGTLEYLVYSGGAWVNSTEMDETTATKDAYLYDNYTISANAAAKDLGITSGNTLTIDATSALNLAGDLTAIGGLSATAGGSLIVAGTSSGNITYNVNVSDSNWHLVSSPVAGESYDDTWANNNVIADGSGTNRGIATYQNGTTDETTGPWVYMLDGESGTFVSGTGYSLKRTNSGPYSFTGTLPTTSITTAITKDVTNWNLIGNPYPSYINIETFLSTNSTKLSGAFQSIYVWNASTDSYNDLATGFVHPGQAFFVNAAATPETVSFTEAMQSHQTGITLYKTESTTVINLNLKSGESTKSTQINYLKNKTTGLDPRFDIGLFDGTASNVRIYTHLISENEGISFRRQTLPASNYEALVIPVGVMATENSEITFSANALNLQEGLHVYLEDKLNNTFTRLGIENSEYKTTITAAKTENRFYLHTKTASVLNTPAEVLDNVTIYKTNNSNLRITGLQKGTASISIFSVLGKKIMNTNFEASSVKNISLPNLASGVYIVKLQTKEGSLNKKIIFE